MARHYSPPGTFEAIRKEVLEDPTWTAAEFRVLGWLAAKPDDWVIHPKIIVDGTGLSMWAVRGALTGLRRRDLVYDEAVRSSDGRIIIRWDTRFRRSRVVATLPPPPKTKPQVGSTETNSGGVDANVSPQVRSNGPDSGGVDTNTNSQVRGSSKTLPQVRSTAPDPGGGRHQSKLAGQGLTENIAAGQVNWPDSQPPRDPAPIREDGKSFSEDGPKDVETSAARTNHAQPATGPGNGGEQEPLFVAAAALADSARDGLGTPDPDRPATAPAKNGQDGRGTPDTVTAQTVLKKFIDWDRGNGGQLTRRTIGQLAKHITDLLDQGIDEKYIKFGLADWRASGQHPSTLDSFVNAAMKGRAQRARPAGSNGRQPSARNPTWEDLQNDWKDDT